MTPKNLTSFGTGSRSLNCSVNIQNSAEMKWILPKFGYLEIYICQSSLWQTGIPPSYQFSNGMQTGCGGDLDEIMVSTGFLFGQSVRPWREPSRALSCKWFKEKAE